MRLLKELRASGVLAPEQKTRVRAASETATATREFGGSFLGPNAEGGAGGEADPLVLTGGRI